MRAARQTMQRADSQGCMTVDMRSGFAPLVAMSIYMDVYMAFAVVYVLVGVHMVTQRTTKTPEANSNQQCADQPLAPG